MVRVNQPICCPYEPYLPTIPGTLLGIALIFSLVTPYCAGYSAAAIILGAISLTCVLFPACVRFDDGSSIRILFSVSGVLAFISFILEALCRASFASIVALVFWFIGAVVALITGCNPPEPRPIETSTSPPAVTAPNVSSSNP